MRLTSHFSFDAPGKMLASSTSNTDYRVIEQYKPFDSTSLKPFLDLDAGVGSTAAEMNANVTDYYSSTKDRQPASVSNMFDTKLPTVVSNTQMMPSHNSLHEIYNPTISYTKQTQQPQIHQSYQHPREMPLHLTHQHQPQLHHPLQNSLHHHHQHLHHQLQHQQMQPHKTPVQHMHYAQFSGGSANQIEQKLTTGNNYGNVVQPSSSANEESSNKNQKSDGARVTKKTRRKKPVLETLQNSKMNPSLQQSLALPFQPQKLQTQQLTQQQPLHQQPQQHQLSHQHHLHLNETHLNMLHNQQQQQQPSIHHGFQTYPPPPPKHNSAYGFNQNVQSQYVNDYHLSVQTSQYNNYINTKLASRGLGSTFEPDKTTSIMETVNNAAFTDNGRDNSDATILGRCDTTASKASPAIPDTSTVIPVAAVAGARSSPVPNAPPPAVASNNAFHNPFLVAAAAASTGGGGGSQHHTPTYNSFISDAAQNAHLFQNAQYQLQRQMMLGQGIGMHGYGHLPPSTFHHHHAHPHPNHPSALVMHKPPGQYNSLDRPPWYP